jgi:hypothetical protein
MSERNTVLRSLHDLGLVAWCGGSLMGAVGLNGAAEDEGTSETSTVRIASAGWDRWAPVNAVAIVAHLIGGSGLLTANAARVQHQQGVAASTVAKTAMTGAALAATAYARVLGKKIDKACSGDAEERAAADQHPMPIDKAKRQLAAVQWAVPVLTAGIVVLNALHGEQQRPLQQKSGMLQKMTGIGLHS